MKKRLLSMFLAFGLIFGLNASPAFAADDFTEATEAGKQGTLVTITLDDGKEVVDDEFVVTIPKKLVASSKNAVAYTVNASGFLNEGKTLNVVPSGTVALKPSASDAANKYITLNSTVTQNKTQWSPDDLAVEGGVDAAGSLSAVTYAKADHGDTVEDEPTTIDEVSGNFTGTLLFTISVDEA